MSTEQALTRGAILGAALALPGLAVAESAPADGLVAFKFLNYRDAQSAANGQPALKRITVNAPSIYALLPVSSAWTIEGSAVIDDLSGATPRWHSSTSSASKMEDERTAGDLKITRYFRRVAVGVGTAFSTEDDYKSLAFSTDARIATEDNNTLFAFGVGLSNDEINSTGGAIKGEKKKLNDILLGVTQVLSPLAVAKLNLTHSRASGYLSDPYKVPDVRPRERNSTALLGQFNRHFAGSGASLRTSYRYFTDSFGIRAHTLGFDWAQPLGVSWVVTPTLRYHTQSSARFYCDAIPGVDSIVQCAVPPGSFVSADHRLSAFGAVTLGVKAAFTIGKLTVDAKLERYEQRGDWRVGGDGSPGLAPFTADIIQVGVARRF